MVRTYTDAQGLPFISEIDSWLVWREKTKGFTDLESFPAARTNAAYCPLCQKDRIVTDEKYGRMYCLCFMLQYQQKIGLKLNKYRTPFDLFEVVPIEKMDDRNQPDMIEAISAFKHFVNTLDSWLLVSGPRGTGKTNLLMSTATKLGPMALYLSADDFEHRLFYALETGNVVRFMNDIKRAPVLLFDDWGTEYGQSSSGSSFVNAKFRAIINWRYAYWREFPTAVTTNWNPAQVLEQDARVGSRLRDDRRSKLLVINISDYRDKKNRRNHASNS